MKKIVTMLVGAAALATVTAGMAASTTNSMDVSQNDNSAAGLFVSGNLGYGKVDYKKSDFSTPPTTFDNSGLAWNANVGYQFNQYLAVEGGYTHFAQTKATVNGVSLTSSLGGFGLNAKGILPINEQFNVFAKAGAIDLNETVEAKEAGASDKVTGSSWTPELGLGASYNVNKNAALTLQGIHTFKTHFNTTVDGLSARGTIPQANAILAGVSYKFAV